MAPTLAWQEVLIGFSLISASIPCLRGFVGRFTTADLSRVYNNSTTVSGPRRESYELQSLGVAESNSAHVRLRPEDFGCSIEVNGTRMHASEEASIESGGSEQMIIRRKREWHVETTA